MIDDSSTKPIDNQDNRDKPLEEQKSEQLKLSFKWFIKSFSSQLADFVSIRKGADIPNTIENIRKDTEFTGHNIWVLILSILIASIGLNLNSTAVVIGAMLISPLMGPILGLGLSLATFNIKLLITAVRNLIVMVVVSVLASYIYFVCSPLDEVQPEIIARTQPHFFDALIAIFGGLAGIIGNSRSERTNMIPGVAIATALMPPLCTVGYGLAVENYQYVMGASYLFLLNTSFIGITCFIIIRVMGFPMATFVDKKRENRVKIFVFLFAISVIVPSIFTLINTLHQLRFKQSVEKFINTEFIFENSHVVKQNAHFDKENGSTLEVFILGDPLDSLLTATLESKKVLYELDNTALSIFQSSDNSKEFEKEIQVISEQSVSYEEQLITANKTIAYQELRIKRLQIRLDSINIKPLPTEDIKKELAVLFPDLETVTLGRLRDYTDTTLHGTPIFMLNWKNKRMSTSYKRKNETRIYDWLKLKLNADTLIIAHD